MKKIKLITSLCIRFVKTGGIASLVYVSGVAGVQAELPVMHPAIPWSSNVRITQQTDNLLRIGQNQGRPGNWILNWQSFNIDEGSRVQFDQPSSNHIALNRIYQNSPSRILGSIDANGRIYLINQNGFTFGKKSTINVNSLVASSLALNMSDNDFIDGNKNIASLVSDGEAAFDINNFLVEDEAGNIIIPVPDVNDLKGITIESGAQITAEDGGNVLMFAPTIENSGQINTRSGQAILAAAKDRVYLTPSQDPALRGFLVEVDTGGTVENLGRILSERGNITLAGIAINQKGVLEATSSVSENGSIRLLARDAAKEVNTSIIDGPTEELILGIDLDAAKDSNGSSIKEESYFVASETGEVTLYEGSRTSISVDDSDETLITDAQKIQDSRVEITGNEIRVKNDAEIKVTGGEVILHATGNVQETAITDKGDLNSRDNSQIIVESGSRIDVSGSTTAEIEMSRNELEVTLTGNFLRDAPLQRNGEIRNETVTVDIRDGTPLGDISDLVTSNIKRGINELTADAGSVNIISRGGVLLEEGSEINISGGSVSYNNGYVTSSQLLTENGRLVDISNADPGLVYSGVFGKLQVESERWGAASQRNWSVFGGNGNGITRFYQGYVEGKDAGSLNIQTHAAAALDHTLVAGTVNGVYQRDASQRASGGDLQITLGTQQSLNGGQSVLLTAIREGEKITEAKLGAFLDTSEQVADWTLELGNNLTSESGISNLSVNTRGNITSLQSSNIDLSDNGSLSLQGDTVSINGDISIASGNIKISAQQDLLVTSVIDTSGNWVNDNNNVPARDLKRPVNLDGGSIELSTTDGNLLLADSYLKANGGAWLQSDGSLVKGDGGSIKLSLNDNKNDVASIELGRFEAYSAARGGALSIEADQINIASEFSSLPQTGELQFTPAFFQSNGFSDFTLISNGDKLSVQGNTIIAPTTLSLLFNSDINTQQSTDSLLDITEEGYLPEYVSPTTNLSLLANTSGARATLGNGLFLDESARIQMTADSNVNLAAVSNLIMRGVIQAPGGDVSLELNNDGLGYQDSAAIWFDGSIITNGNTNGDGVVENTAMFIADAANDQGLITGRVLDSGSVSFNANRGYIVTTERSEINVSGTEHAADLPSVVLGNTTVEYQRQLVSGDAGNINFTAAEGMYLAGSMQAQAPSVTGASGGQFNLTLDTSNRTADSVGAYNPASPSSGGVTTQGRELHLVQSLSDLPDNFFASDAHDNEGNPLVDIGISNESVGKAWLASELISDAGFDRLRLQSNNIRGDSFSTANNTGTIVFDGNIDLELSQSLELISPVIRAESDVQSQVNLSAPYVLLGSISNLQPHENTATSNGLSLININAGIDGQNGLLELMGNVYLQGISDVNLSSEGDIRLRGIRVSGTASELTGSFNSFGDMTLRADQVYATTLSQFDLSIAGDVDGVMRINSGSEVPPALSAGSILGLNAPVIEQHGAVIAPLGQINFNATQSLVLGEQSITSVSADGLVVPFGSTLAEERWIYPLTLDTSSGDYIDITTPPSKEINLQSPDIQIADAAVFDISGGGDLSSWEFVPGLGGSVDTLLPSNANAAFAIIPGNPVYAPYDAQYWLAETEITMGDQVYLAGTADLAEGLYTVLPARYALLPGAHLVTPTGDSLLPSQQFTRLDGAPIIAGQSRVAGTNAHSNVWTGYVIESSDAVRQRSEYFETTASQFYRDESQRTNTFLPAMPEDAGTLNILAGNKLSLSGELRADAASVDFLQGDEILTAQGRGSLLNISGDNLRVVAEQDNQGGIQIEDKQLNGFDADSILLGGIRERSVDGVDINVTASDIEISENVNLNMPELMLAAQNTITVKNGATITARGETTISESRINIDGDGALLRASVNEQVSVNRINESTNPAQGSITLEQGSQVDASKSVVLDSSLDTNLNGTLRLNGGSLNLGASKISIGDLNINSITGIGFTKNQLEALDAGSLVLSSRTGIDLYGGLELNLNNLELQTSSLNGYQNDGSVFRVVAANTIKLSNPSGYTSAAAGTGSGALELDAKNIQLANGNIDISGFTDINIKAQQDIISEGNGSLIFANNGNVTLDGRLTTASTTEYAIEAANAELLIQRTSASVLDESESLGGKLSISASHLTHSGQIDIASGSLELTASSGDVLLNNSSVINLSGVDRDFVGELIYTPGGSLILSSELSDIQIKDGAKIDISSTGDAGSLELNAAQGNVSIEGNIENKLIASAGESANAASFISNSQSFENLSQINQQLNNEFNNLRHIRLGAGDINLAANESIIAQDVSLQTDNGNLNILGAINASGGKGGNVHLAAQNNSAVSGDVILNIAGVITASALATDGEGGDVHIESRGEGLIDLTGNIDVSGGAESRGGKIYIRTPRTAANDDININSLEFNNLTGYRRFDIEGFETYTLNNIIDVSKFTGAGEYFADSTVFMSNANTVTTRLGLSAQPEIHLRAGIELNSANDITLDSTLDLIDVRFGSEAGILTLRAEGDININQNLEDGFRTEAFNLYSLDALQTGESWSYRLAAGADLSAAATATVTGNTANINLANDKMIRTGTGDLDLVAANHISLGKNAAIYTAGHKGAGTGIDQSITINTRAGAITSSFANWLVVPGIEFPEDGGDISIRTGGDLIADTTSSLLVTDWLYRVGANHTKDPVDSEVPFMTGISFANFTDGIGALGGGDVNIESVGDIRNIAVSVPVTEKYTGDVSVVTPGSRTISSHSYNGTETLQTGNGDITVSVGGDIRQSLFFTGNGDINVSAGGDIGSAISDSGIFIVAAETRANISAGGDLVFQGVSTPGLLPYSSTQSALLNVSGSNQFSNYFSEYSEKTSIELTSLSGSIEIRNSVTDVFNSATDLNEDAFKFYPGDFRAVAIDGDIDIKGNIIQWPSEFGGISLLAQNNIIAFNDEIGLSINMLDIAPENLPTKFNSVSNFVLIPRDTLEDDSERLLHANDSNPSRLVANLGDITSTDLTSRVTIATNEHTEVFAGQDIKGIGLRIQNTTAENISTIEAGRDIVHVNAAETGGSPNNEIEVSGPGELHVLAGRDISLGDQRGITSIADFNNAALPAEAAELIVMAGLGEQGANYSGFIDQYFTVDSEYSNRLVDFMNQRNSDSLDFEKALQQFKQLEEKEQRSLVISAFTNEFAESATRAAKEQANDPDVNDGRLLGYTRGIDAIAILYPGTVQSSRDSVTGEVTGGDLIVTGGTTYVLPDSNSQYAGNISMVASTIQSLGDEGDISILAPGGFLNVGLSVSSGDDTREKGIITKGDGNISVFAQGNISVNQSRVQALNGGFIAGWSTKGDVDAGRGAKDALNIPPPRTIINSDGSIVQVFDAAVQGNGIRTACFDEGCSPGFVTLAAPAGVIDAGDAGINAGGNLILATDTVLNANQIEAGGDSTGVPADAGALGADLGGLDVNSSGEDSATELAAVDASDQFGAGSVAILQVEVMGLSGESDEISAPSSIAPASNNGNSTDENIDKKSNQQSSNENMNKEKSGPDLSMNTRH